MTDEEIIAKVAALFGHNYTPYTPKNAQWNTTYKFTLKGTSAAQVMQRIYPFMSQRRQTQIDRALVNYVYNLNSNITASKISEEQVRAIKLRLAGGETAKSIARDFPVSHFAIWDIRSGKTWGHISLDSTPETRALNRFEFPELTVSDENLFHWMVGLLEAEGSFMTGTPSEPFRPRIAVAMTDEDVISRLSQRLRIRYLSLRSRNERHKNVYRVMVRGSRAIEVMEKLYPFLGKRRQSQIDRVLKSYTSTPRNTRPTAKITERQAREIKQRVLNGENINQIAQDFNVSESIVREIKLGRTWKHIIV